MMGVNFQYETVKIKYQIPTRFSTYTPDFILPNGILIETKGDFLAADRKKHLLVKEQHPELDIRFVFGNARRRLSPSSKTTYAGWCQQYGFKWAHGSIPLEWIREPCKKKYQRKDYKE